MMGLFLTSFLFLWLDTRHKLRCVYGAASARLLPMREGEKPSNLRRPIHQRKQSNALLWSSPARTHLACAPRLPVSAPTATAASDRRCHLLHAQLIPPR